MQVQWDEITWASIISIISGIFMGAVSFICTYIALNMDAVMPALGFAHKEGIGAAQLGTLFGGCIFGIIAIWFFVFGIWLFYRWNYRD